jgi:hypothetical protein
MKVIPQALGGNNDIVGTIGIKYMFKIWRPDGGWLQASCDDFLSINTSAHS